MKDFNLDDSSVFLTDEVALIIQQIDLLFDTNEDEVYGEQFGSKFYDLLWDSTLSAQDISDYTLSLIKYNINLQDWQVHVETNFLEGTQNDIMLITIKLSNDSYEVEKTYRID